MNAKRMKQEAGPVRAGLRISLATRPHLLPLIGAARSVPDACAGNLEGVIVADFGHTRAKSALAIFDGRGALAHLNSYPALYVGDITGGDKTEALAAAMTQVISAAYREGQRHAQISQHIVCSIASYLDERGEPLPSNRGAYNRLHTLTQGELFPPGLRVR